MRADAYGSVLRVGRTASGFLVRVEGRGTMSESPALQEFAARSLDGPSAPGTMVVDLSCCDYLDSTFLGCLLNLHRQYNRTSPHRFQVAASGDKRQKLLAPTHLVQVLDLTEVCPQPIGDVLEFDRPSLAGSDLGRHVMECHALLADLGGSRAVAFRSIADQLARELGDATGDADAPTGEYPAPSRQGSPGKA
jgi:anti-anti-sigma regulatory factor